jgi:hypothetical protein
MDYIKVLTNGALDATDAIDVLNDVREEFTTLWLEKFTQDDGEIPTTEYMNKLLEIRTHLLILIESISHEVV